MDEIASELSRSSATVPLPRRDADADLLRIESLRKCSTRFGQWMPIADKLGEWKPCVLVG
jgi:hypothetical protein